SVHRQRRPHRRRAGGRADRAPAPPGRALADARGGGGGGAPLALARDRAGSLRDRRLAPPLSGHSSTDFSGVPFKGLPDRRREKPSVESVLVLRRAHAMA